METHSSNRSTFALCGGCLLLLLSCGCPWTTRYPLLNPESLEGARRSSQLQDPFPDHNIGPDTDFRPREFGTQRSEQQVAKSRAYASWLRIQASPSSVQPPPAFTPGQNGPALPGMGFLPAPGYGPPSRYGYPPPAMGTLPPGALPGSYPQRPF